MIIVIAEVILQKGKNAELLAAAEPCIAATRKEAGNLSYRLLQDPADDTHYTFVEEWETQEALGVHGQSAHFQAFSGAAAALCAAPLDIKVYAGEKVQG